MFILTSAKLEDQGIMPDKYSMAKGENTSPPLAWSGAPQGAKSFALTCIDPDVPWGKFGLPNPGVLPGDLFIHWMVYDIPASASRLDEGAGSKGSLPAGAKQLENGAADFGKDSPFYAHRIGYIGCAPPAGDKAHRYIFTAYALNVDRLGIAPTARYPELLSALAGKVLARSSLTVYFGVKG